MKHTWLLVYGLMCYSCLWAQQWREMGPCGSPTYGNTLASQGGTGQVHCIVFDPDTANIVYAASPFGGLWRSTDGGRNWSNETIDTLRQLLYASVNDVLITRKGNVKTLWIATGHPGARGEIVNVFEPYTCGIHFSTDNGCTFHPLQSFNERFNFRFGSKKHISRIVAHPHNPDRMFVASSDGLYATTDGGRKWKLVLKETELPQSNPYTQGIFSVEFSKTNSDKVVYAAGADVYRSAKGGRKGSFTSFSHHGTDFFDEVYCLADVNFNVEVNAENGHDILYAPCFVKGDTCGAFRNRTTYLFFYFDGKQWVKKNEPPGAMPDGIRLKVASVPQQPNIVYAGSGVSAVSNDYGLTWKQATDYNQPGHADIHALAVIPGSNDVLVGTDGGIFRYDYETKKVDEYNNGLCMSLVIDMGASPTDTSKILIGKQDVGADIWNGNEWTKLPAGGDGYYGQHIDFQNAQLYFSCHNGIFFRNQTASGFNLKPLYTCQPAGTQCPTAFAQHPVFHHRYYFARKELYKSNDFGSTWCRISDFANFPGIYINPEGHYISNIETFVGDSNFILLSFNANPDCCNSYLFRHRSGGMFCNEPCGTPSGSNNWELINTPSLYAGSDNERFHVNSLYYISGIAISDKTPEHFWLSYTCNDLEQPPFKVLCTKDGGKTWQSDDEGLPNMPCRKIMYVPGKDDQLLLATWTGVYHKYKGQPWQPLGSGLPSVYISDMEYHPGTGKLRVATFGRGVWEIDLP